MMRIRTLLISILLFAIAASVFAVGTAGEPQGFYLMGYIDSATTVQVDILDNALPFNIDSAEVAKNDNYLSEVRGLRIGTYTLISNNINFTFTVTHDKLKLIGSPRFSDKVTEIDYRLYLFLDNSAYVYYTCLSGGSIQLTGSEVASHYNINEELFFCSLVGQSLYVSLNVDSTKNVHPGDYESYVTFVLEGQ